MTKLVDEAGRFAERFDFREVSVRVKRASPPGEAAAVIDSTLSELNRGGRLSVVASVLQDLAELSDPSFADIGGRFAEPIEQRRQRFDGVRLRSTGEHDRPGLVARALGGAQQQGGGLCRGELAATHLFDGRLNLFALGKLSGWKTVGHRFTPRQR